MSADGRNNAPRAALLGFDRLGRVTLAAGAIEKWFGVAPDAIRGAAMASLFSASTIDVLKQAVETSGIVETSLLGGACRVIVFATDDHGLVTVVTAPAPTWPTMDDETRHNLRNLGGAIAGFSGLLLHDGDLSSTTRADVEEINRAASALLTILAKP
jgi:hypothetical protein